jgi:multidrug efflux pump subunit AcrA (membrane-fusion protein)
VDVARPPKKKTGRYIAIGGGVLLLIIATIALGKLKPAAPTVEMSVVIQDSVRQGDMIREVRGPGTLVPEQIQQVTAPATARVDRMDVQAGQSVNAGDPLLEMSSPDVMISTMTADQQLNQAQATLLTLRTSLKSSELSQQGLVASTRTQYIAATQDAAASDTLLKQHLIAQFDATNKRALADQLTAQYKYEQQRLLIMQQSVDSEIAAATTNIQQLKSIADFYHNKQKSLTVRAPATGVVQGMTLQQGQYITEGSLLLKVVQPGRLKAVLQIPESQAKDVAIGQSASIDTRSSGLIAGHVSRKDPSAIGGTVTVDVALNGALPQGAVPDLSVDGTIQIEKLKNVLYTGRPGYGGATGPVGLFKIVENGHAAVRIQVLLGRSSVTSVEIVKGLNVGDKVILSDMQQWDGVDRVRLKQ